MSLLTSLVSSWELNEASGNALDSHGSNTLTETSGTIGASSGPGGSGGSRDFEAGDTEYFTLADNADLSVGDIDWTIEVWANFESKNVSGQGVILSKWDAGASQREYQIDYDSGTDRIRFVVSNNGTSSTTHPATTLGSPSTGTWYQIVASHDAASNLISIQVNNGTANTTSYSLGGRNGTAAFALGANFTSGAPQNHFDGLISKARLWKRLLTSGEITSLYNSGNGLAYSSFGGSSYSLTADRGIYTLTGNVAGLFRGLKVTSGVGSFTLSGQASNLLRGVKAVADAGAFTLSGQAAGLLTARRVASDVGSYTLTGQAAGLRADRRMTSGVGTYTLTGNVADLLRGLKVAGGVGSFTLTGRDAGLQYSGGNPNLTAGTGSFMLTGQTANLLRGLKLAAASGTFTETGIDAGLNRGLRLTVSNGTYTLSGIDANLAKGLGLIAGTGAFIVTGRDVSFRRTRNLAASRGTFTLTGQTASLTYSNAEDPGPLTLTGFSLALDLTFTGFELD